MKSAAFASLALAALAIPQTASAAIVSYTDQAAFLAAITSSGVDTFNSLPDFTPATSPLTRTAGAFGYTAAASGDFYTAGGSSDIWLSTNTATDPITLGTFTGGVYSLGGLFFTSDVNGAYTPGAITVSVLAGGTSASSTVSASTVSSFLGFVSDTPLTSARVASVQPSTGFLWPTLNNLTLGGAAVAAVPEPSTWAMMMLGFGLVGAALRRAPRSDQRGRSERCA